MRVPIEIHLRKRLPALIAGLLFVLAGPIIGLFPLLVLGNERPAHGYAGTAAALCPAGFVFCRVYNPPGRLSGKIGTTHTAAGLRIGMPVAVGEHGREHHLPS